MIWWQGGGYLHDMVARRRAFDMVARRRVFDDMVWGGGGGYLMTWCERVGV